MSELFLWIGLWKKDYLRSAKDVFCCLKKDESWYTGIRSSSFRWFSTAHTWQDAVGRGHVARGTPWGRTPR